MRAVRRMQANESESALIGSDSSESSDESVGADFKESHSFCCSLRGACLSGCACWCCSIAIVLLFVLWFIHGANGARYSPVGANTVALGFASDMISLLFGEGVPGYASSWCPNGLATCDKRDNFPGPDTTSYMRWDDVWEMGSRYPEREWSGQIWRGNELGFIINNPLFWSNVGISPQSIALGITPKQHAAIRPNMEAMWTIGGQESEKYKSAESVVKRRIGDFLKRDQISLPSDTVALVHQILNEVALKRDMSFEDALKFVEVQGKVVTFGTIGQLVPGFLYDAVMGEAAEGARGIITEYVQIVERLFGEQLKDEDCSPSVNCSVQAAAALWDTLYAAGGLSVPGTINTGLGIMYSAHESNPAQGASYEKAQAAQFYWENIRFFPPVVGFPHWKKRPTCAGSTANETAALMKPNGKSEACKLGTADMSTGYPKVNQYLGGMREVPNLALAMWDPRKWGIDSDQFKLRSLQEYEKNSVAFAEMAVNDGVAGGGMNRACPGRKLALLIGTVFFEEFNATQWQTGDAVKFSATTPFVGKFSLQKRISWAPPSCVPSQVLQFGIALFTVALRAHD